MYPALHAASSKNCRKLKHRPHRDHQMQNALECQVLGRAHLLQAQWTPYNDWLLCVIDQIRLPEDSCRTIKDDYQPSKAIRTSSHLTCLIFADRESAGRWGSLGPECIPEQSRDGQQVQYHHENGKCFKQRHLLVNRSEPDLSCFSFTALKAKRDESVCF